MPSLKVIRKRIASVKSTQKITKAMKMVAGARLNRAQQRILAVRPYAVKTGEILRSVAGGESGAGDEENPLLARRPEERVLLVVFSGDRGLCGAFNTNVNKATERRWRELEKEGKRVSFATVGRKGKEYLQRRGGTIAKDFPKIYDALDLPAGARVGAHLVARFKRAEVDAIEPIYNEFKSAITQKVTWERLLPLPESGRQEGQKGDLALDFIFEPDKSALLARLVPMYVEIAVYRAMLESQAGFFGAQMTAMDSATRNAKEMIGRLTLAYNRARQAAITKELMEIIGGAEALKE